MVLPTSGSISISDINSCARFTNGNVGINTTSPDYNLDVNGTLKATNIISTTISAGTLVGTTFTGGSMSLSNNLTIGGNFVGNTLTLLGDLVMNSPGTLLGKNAEFTGILVRGKVTSTSLEIADGGAITTGSLKATNANVTLCTVGTLINTNIVSTNASAGTINGTNALFTNITSSNISIPGFINTQIDTNTTTIQPDLIGAIKDGGIHYWSKNIISDTTYVNWGPVYNEYNLTRVKGISNVSGSSLSVQIRITGTAQNNTDISDITGTFYVANSSGNLVSTIYEYTVAKATGTMMLTPGVLAIDTGYITVSIPQGGSIQLKDNFANDSTYLMIQSPYVYINVLTSKTNIPTLLNTNIVSTNVSAATLNLSTGLTSASARITGNVSISGALSKGSGTFDIQHPLHQDDKTKRLVHSFIEGPRCDLIYRGKVQLANGTATINIDSDCVEETGSGMSQGTFEALCANPQFFLQNPTSFSRLKGTISGNILTVVCEDQNSSDIIYWSVITERKDIFIKQWQRTNANGYLITEYDTFNDIDNST